MKYPLTFALLLAGFAGCDTPPPTTVTSEPAPAEVTAEVTEDMLVNLAAADQLDGTEDHVIGKCYVCRLGMDGKPEFTVQVGDYTAHLCKEHCREHFASNWPTVVEETEIPDAQPEVE